jgi:hypothetical protein
MAKRISDLYPSQVDTSDPIHFPGGKAKNSDAVDAHNGTPLEKGIVNQILGFFEGLLAGESIDYDGSEETATTGQYVPAINKKIIRIVTDFLSGLVEPDAPLELGNESQGIHLPGPLGVDGDATVVGDVSARDLDASRDLNVGRNAEVAGSMAVTGDASSANNFVGGDITFGNSLSGAGAIQYRNLIGADANGSYGPGKSTPNRADLVIVDTLTAARTYTIDDTGSLNAMRIWFVNNSTFELTISKPGPTALLILQPGGAVMCERVSGTWRVAIPNFGASRGIIGADAGSAGSPQLYPPRSSVVTLAITADRVYQIDATNQMENDEIEFSTSDTGSSIDIENPDGDVIANIVNTSGNVRAVRFKLVAGSWRTVFRDVRP